MSLDENPWADLADAGRRARGQEGSLEGVLGLQGFSGCRLGAC